MQYHAFPITATLLATAAFAQQQFRVELQRDVLGQKPIHRVDRPAAGDLDGDGRIDLCCRGPKVWLDRGNSFGEVATTLPQNVNGMPPTLVDVDGDSDLDVVQWSGVLNIQLFLNDGAAGFTDVSASHMPANIWTAGSAVPADVDGDGDQDLLLPSGRLLVNDGLGVFTDETATRVLSKGFSIGHTVAVADFDGDGDLDFVIMSGLHHNDGKGVFQVDTTAGMQFGYGEAIFASDFDQDGDHDILTSLGRLLRNDDGAFMALDNLIPPSQVDREIAAVADFDGDGVDDLLVNFGTAAGGYNTAWVANDGQGGFVFSQPMLLPARHTPIAAPLVADLDMDGDNDLVVTRPGHSQLPALAEVLYNDGLGHWHNATELGGLDTGRSYERLAADMDGDGSQDIVTGGSVAYNDGRGTFDRHTFPFGGGPAVIRCIADFDGDGDLDLLDDQSLWLNAGSGQPMASIPLLTGTDRIGDAVAVDVDGDQDHDLLVVAGPWASPSSVRMFLNDGAGQFTAVSAVQRGITLVQAASLQSGDFDGDGDLDLVLGAAGFFIFGGSSVHLFANDGSGSFQEQALPVNPWSAGKIHTADFDGDGDLDFLVESPNVAVLFVNVGGGQFSTLPMTTWIGNRFLPDDIDGDGDIDLWTLGNLSGWVRLFVNDGSNTFTEAPERVDPDRPGSYPAVDAVLVDFEGDGDRDVVVIAEDSGTQTQFAVPLWNHARQLRAPHLTRIGSALDLFVSAVEVQPAPSVVFVLVSDSSASIPLGDLGVLGVDPNAVLVLPVAMPSGGGTQHVTVSVPALPSLQGMPLFAQALFAAPGQLRLSGTVENTILH